MQAGKNGSENEVDTRGRSEASSEMLQMMVTIFWLVHILNDSILKRESNISLLGC